MINTINKEQGTTNEALNQRLVEELEERYEMAECSNYCEGYNIF